MKYLVCASPMILGNEILSMMCLVALAVCFWLDCVKARYGNGR